jgi:hypothetical protein
MSSAIWQDRDHRDICRDGTTLAGIYRRCNKLDKARGLAERMLAMAKYARLGRCVGLFSMLLGNSLRCVCLGTEMWGGGQRTSCGTTQWMFSGRRVWGVRGLTRALWLSRPVCSNGDPQPPALCIYYDQPFACPLCCVWAQATVGEPPTR